MTSLTSNQKMIGGSDVCSTCEAHCVVIEDYISEVTALKRENERLTGILERHNTSCQDLCGHGDEEAVRCGYRPYFKNNGRRCPVCPVDDIIDYAPEEDAKPAPSLSDTDSYLTGLIEQSGLDHYPGWMFKDGKPITEIRRFAELLLSGRVTVNGGAE
jgi:hypothetical protein